MSGCCELMWDKYWLLCACTVCWSPGFSWQRLVILVPSACSTLRDPSGFWTETTRSSRLRITWHMDALIVTPWNMMSLRRQMVTCGTRGVILCSYLMGYGVCSLEGKKTVCGQVFVCGPHSADANSRGSRSQPIPSLEVSRLLCFLPCTNTQRIQRQCDTITENT